MYYDTAVKTIRKMALCLLLLLFCRVAAGAVQQVEDVAVPSAAMERAVHSLVMLPEGYDGQKCYPVVFLLHGWNMKCHEWLRVQRDLPKLATEHGLILVCPDAANSWYWDSPVNPSLRYETFVACELPEYVRSHYKTIDSPRARAVTGLSMGGHGALWLAIRHQDVFGACGAMSGAVDIRPFPNRWNIADALGPFEDNPERWAAHTVMTQLHLIRPGLSIIIDCGTEDFFHEVNATLHRELLARKVPHDSISRPGAHNARSWRNAILYQLLFFSELFRTLAEEEKAE